MRSRQDSLRQFAMLLLSQFQDQHRIARPQLPPRDWLTQVACSVPLVRIDQYLENSNSLALLYRQISISRVQ